MNSSAHQPCSVSCGELRYLSRLRGMGWRGNSLLHCAVIHGPQTAGPTPAITMPQDFQLTVYRGTDTLSSVCERETHRPPTDTQIIQHNCCEELMIELQMLDRVSGAFCSQKIPDWLKSLKCQMDNHIIMKSLSMCWTDEGTEKEEQAFEFLFKTLGSHAFHWVVVLLLLNQVQHSLYEPTMFKLTIQLICIFNSRLKFHKNVASVDHFKRMSTARI